MLNGWSTLSKNGDGSGNPLDPMTVSVTVNGCANREVGYRNRKITFSPDISRVIDREDLTTVQFLVNDETKQKAFMLSDLPPSRKDNTYKIAFTSDITFSASFPKSFNLTPGRFTVERMPGHEGHLHVIKEKND